MISIVSPESIRDILVSAFRSKSLVPIVGSGFTYGLKATSGIVPDGKKYKEHMISELVRNPALADNDKSELSQCTFSQLCDYYEDDDLVSDEVRIEYLRAHFYRVFFPENDIRKKILTIDWPYIYTLNVDDAIESSSDYNTVISPCGGEYREKIFSSNKCVIKLHGDILDIVKYKNSPKVFTSKEYILSLDTNAALLSKLKNDISNQNVIIIGCSLDDEVDLKSLSNTTINNPTKDNLSHSFLFVKGTPSKLQISKYKTYGVTEVVTFPDYDSMYDFLYGAWSESTQIQQDELSQFSHIGLINLDASQKEKNQNYYLWGKGLLSEKKKELIIPYYFISRAVTKKIIMNLPLNKVHFLVGGHISGKTYLLADLYRTIRDRTVYYFSSKSKLSNRALDSLLHSRGIVVLLDTNALTRDQLELIVTNCDLIKQNENNVIVAINKNDSDSFGLVKWKLRQGIIQDGDIIRYSIDNRFSLDELTTINKYLPAIDLTVFLPDRTILDQLIYEESVSSKSGRFTQHKLKIADTAELSLLIVIAIKEKLSSLEIVQFGFEEILGQALKKYSPFIEKTNTFDFEKDEDDYSQFKYILNSKYWLQRELGEFARNDSNHEMVINAFYYIVDRIIRISKNDYYIYRKKVRDFIMFDILNDVFLDKHRGNLQLIMKVYEKLQILLSDDYNFLHQKAKCYMNCGYGMKDKLEKEEYFNNAKKLAFVSESMIVKKMEHSDSETLQIALSHVHYTIAAVSTELCILCGYKNLSELENTISYLLRALESPYNSNDFKKDAHKRYSHGIPKFCSSISTLLDLEISQSAKQKLIDIKYRMRDYS